ncbi:hemolysin family protein [Frankia sp. Mgl5]|uniref:hemolysin family protein n=1 Tax=Frankia sp. Mgl5 TaxID=2933793 RepID=UPI00200D7B2D|nr:hemolysin family protein [Frankia sp. Mgl5]MCK9928070.1 hemolysin family protein [Frankia sp. Mgl5]
MTEALLLLLSFALVIACGIFVAAEFAFVTVDRPTVERSAADGDSRSAGVLTALRSLSTQLSGAQLGITITNLAIGFLAEPAIADLLEGPVTSLGASEGLARGLSVALALVLATAFTMLYGELVPKNLAIARPLGTARAVQRPQRLFTQVTSPVIHSLNNTANALLRRVNVEPQEELASARSPQELFSLLGRSAEHGTLPRETATLMQRSLTFGDRVAEDVMTPRMRMQSIDADAPVAEVISAVRRTGHARFPVIGDGSDDVVGLIHVKHAVSVPEERRDTVQVRSVMIPAATVPSSMPLEPLLETLRSGGLQMAIVVDEFGGVDGLVTAEDLIEEIVGDVVDEHDRVSPRALRRRDGSWLVSGLLRPEEASEVTGLPIPADDAYQTLGGLMSRTLGRIPGTGDTIVLDGIRYEVERMDGRRVDRIRLDPRGDAATNPARADIAEQPSGEAPATTPPPATPADTKATDENPPTAAPADTAPADAAPTGAAQADTAPPAGTAPAVGTAPPAGTKPPGTGPGRASGRDRADDAGRRGRTRSVSAGVRESER